MDFSRFRSIAVPEGDVASIAHGAEILWRKQWYKTELEYIECNGTQYINTRIRPKLVVEATLQGVEIGTTSSIVLSIGGASSAGDWFGFASTWRLGGGVNFDNRYDEKIMVSCSWTSKGVTATIGDITKSRDGATSGYLFVGSASPSNYPSSCRIFGFKIRKNNEYVGDFIPVLDWNDRPCMYDKITNQLFYNAGTGEFLYA